MPMHIRRVVVAGSLCFAPQPPCPRRRRVRCTHAPCTEAVVHAAPYAPVVGVQQYGCAGRRTLPSCLSRSYWVTSGISRQFSMGLEEARKGGVSNTRISFVVWKATLNGMQGTESYSQGNKWHKAVRISVLTGPKGTVSAGS